MKDENQISDQNLDDSVNQEQKEKDEQVSYDTYQRTVGEAKKEREKRRALEMKVEALEKKEKALELKAIEEQGKYKEAYEGSIKDLEQEKQINEDMRKKIDRTMKLNAFEKLLPGKLHNKDYLSFVKVNEIEMNDEGQIDDFSLKLVVDKFASDHPNLIQNDENELPDENPGDFSDTSLTMPEWEALPAKEQKERYAEIRKNEALRNKQK